MRVPGQRHNPLVNSKAMEKLNPYKKVQKAHAKKVNEENRKKKEEAKKAKKKIRKVGIPLRLCVVHHR